MKNIILILLFIPVLGIAVTSPTFTLTETNGVSITGKMISHSQKTGIVKIQADGSSIQRPFAAFTDASQDLIHLWQADKNFRSSSKLGAHFRSTVNNVSSNITGTITSYRSEKREGVIGVKDSLFRTYHIDLINRSSAPFKDLHVEYRIFYAHQLTETILGKYQLAGEVTCECINAQSSWPFKTTSFLGSIHYKNASGIRWGGRPRDLPYLFEGVLLTVRKKNSAGEWLEKEIEYGEVPRRRDRSDYQKVYE